METKAISKDLLEWLDAKAKERAKDIEFREEAVREEHGWLYIPLYIRNATDSYERAALLQELEDEWNNAEPRRSPRIVLVPAAARPAQDVLSVQIKRDLDEMHRALDEYGNTDNKEAIAEKYWSAQKDYEKHLKELEKIMPRDYPA